MPLSRETSFLRNTSILHFLPGNYLPLGWGSWNLQFLVSLRYRCYKPNKIKIRSSWEDVNARRMTDDDVRQPIAIGHQSYSSDLKIECLLCSMFLSCCLSIQWTIFILLLISVRTPKLHRSEITTLSSQSNKRSKEIPIQSRESWANQKTANTSA